MRLHEGSFRGRQNLKSRFKDRHGSTVPLGQRRAWRSKWTAAASHSDQSQSQRMGSACGTSERSSSAWQAALREVGAPGGMSTTITEPIPARSDDREHVHLIGDAADLSDRDLFTLADAAPQGCRLACTGCSSSAPTSNRFVQWSSSPLR